MSSPFAVFRKHRTVLLAVTGVVAIVLFTVGQFLADFFSSRAQRGRADVVAVKWKGGKLTQSDLYQMKQERLAAYRFAYSVASETISKDGQPRAPGVVFIDKNNWELGLPNDFSDEGLLRSTLLAKQAEKMGIAVSADTVNAYLTQLRDGGTVSRERMAALYNENVGNSVRQARVLEALRQMLSAQAFETVSRSTLVATTFGPVYKGEALPATATPADAWESYLKLNKTARAELLPLAVADFKDQVGEPSEAEIQTLFDAHKDDYPQPNSPDPGFKQPYRVKYQYFKAELASFEKAITDQEIAEHYEKNKAQFRKLELPPSTIDTKPESKPGETSTPPGEKPKDETPKGEEPSSQPPANSEKPAAEQEKPTAEKPAREPANNAPEGAAKPEGAKSEQANPEQPKSDQQSGIEQRDANDFGRLLKAGEYFISADEPEVKAEAESKEGKDDARPNEPKPEAERPKEAKPDDAKPAEAAAPAELNPPQTNSKPDQGTAEKPAAEQASPESTPAAPQYRPLEEVKDQIRQTLARERRSQSLNEAQKTIEQYLTKRRLYEATKGTRSQAKEPTAPDFQAIAKRLNLTFRETPMISLLDFTDITGEKSPGEPDFFELGRAQDTQFINNSFQRITFLETEFRENAPLFIAGRMPPGARSDDSPFASILRDPIDPQFLYWRVEEKASHVPELAEVREQVIDAWKMQKAAVKAREEAQRLADAAQKSKQSLKESLPEQKEKVVETGDFTWMTGGELPQSHGGAPRLSDVSGAKRVGDEFMEAVFSLDPGKVGVAANRPKNTVYVIRLVSEGPGLGVLRNGFAEQKMASPVLQLVLRDGSELYTKWYQHLLKDLDVTWVTPPQSQNVADL